MNDLKSYFENILKVSGKKDEEVMKYEKEMLALEKKSNHEALIRRLKESGIPERYLDSTFDSFIPVTEQDRENLETIKRFSTEEENDRVLLFLGPKGLGKTHLGAAVIRVCGGYFTSMEEIIFQYESSCDFKALRNKEELMNFYSKKRMLVIDEIGRSQQQDKENSILNYLLRRRYEKCLPTILISNMEKEELLKKLGDAVTDRLCETCTCITFSGTSYRIKKRKKEL